MATASIVALTAFAVPRPADALPAYASKPSLACGRCHVSAAGGGALTAFGKAFAANGHKVPSKGAKPGRKAGDGTPGSPEAACRRPTAPVTAPFARYNRQGSNPTFGFNCAVFVASPLIQLTSPFSFLESN